MSVEKLYAICDVETTGGNALSHRITEIAVYVSNGSEIIKEYSTLLNPERAIPERITWLTGISDEMVADAPTFAEKADEIEAIFDNCVFVAHNANFDYGFIKEEFARIGRKFQKNKLCTVRLTRKLIPTLYSYSLGKIALQLGIRIEARHRAWGDAKATCILFHQLICLDSDGEVIKSFLNKNSGESSLPPNLPKEKFDVLPNKQGLYFLKDNFGKVVYIGKAKDLKKRVKTHFYGTSNTKGKHLFIKKIYDLDFELFADDLLLQLKEAEYIKKLWPPYNKEFKRFTLNYGLYAYYDQLGIGRLAIGKAGKFDKPLIVFRQQNELKKFLMLLIDEFQLQAKFCGMPYLEEPDFFGEIADYNQLFESALEYIENYFGSVLLKRRTSNNECVVVWLEKGRLKAYGNVSQEFNCENLEALLPELTAVYDDQDMQTIVHSAIAQESQTWEVIKLEKDKEFDF